MVPAPVHPLDAFPWTPQPEAEALVLSLVQECLSRCPEAADLAGRMRTETGTRFHDWVDTLVAPPSDTLRRRLEAAGYEPRPVAGETVYQQPHGLFPRIVLREGTLFAAFVKVDSASDFLSANRLVAPVEGPALNPLRLARVAAHPEAELWVVERHGAPGLTVADAPDALRQRSTEHLDAFRTRQRDFPLGEEAEGFAHARELIDEAISDLGRDWACDLFFLAEREYWQSRNRAAQVQKARQDKLGLGWANHDHHTYRCSRAWFTRLIAVCETLGFVCRERFYAGLQAGWGAQVLEQPVTGHVIFADVDMSPDELMGDFSHVPMAPRHELGTVGLWCALHGEAFLQAGMHHLECQFDFESLRTQLAAEGIGTMKPFTDFPYLRQAFTEGERWAVVPARVEQLLNDGRLSEEQGQRFLREGAVGSHLENLERNQGFKGFNQTGVSEIIAKTDPRRM